MQEIINQLVLLSPEQNILVAALLVSIFVDLVSGIMTARHFKQPIESRKLIKTAEKISSYVLSIMLIKVLNYILVANSLAFIPVVTICLSFFVLNEAYSIIENLNKLGVKFPKFITSLLKTVEDNLDDPK